ncbi:fimbrial protein [Enterobacter cloacae]|uniref:fimbrial protein n=1 Tax=Enterobacter cloacae TaxID=550 RepID=UPI00345D38EC
MSSRNFFPALLLGTTLSFNASGEEENLFFQGALVAEPCSLAPDSEAIQVDLGSVIDKYLYQHARTPGKGFTITLTECDISLGERVDITIKGEESLSLPGLLKPGSGSTASGIAIGLETPEGEPIPVNATWPRRLDAGNNDFSLQAYVRAEPDAVQNRDIIYGDFSAVVTFALDYP